MWYALIIRLFLRFVKNFLCFKRSLKASKEGKLLKTLLNEKQSNFEKEMDGNISLYSQYFSPGAGSNVH